MPTGITIIEKHEIIKSNFKSWLIILWMAGSIFLGALLYAFTDTNTFTIKNIALTILFCIWGVVFLPFVTKLSLAWTYIYTGRYTYRVLIDDSVPFVALDGYIVRKNEDGTYTLEEKTTNTKKI